MADELTIHGFLEQYGESIQEQIKRHYQPTYQPREDTRRMPELLRSPLGDQDLAIRATSDSLAKQRCTFLVGEMGTGKTLIGIAAAAMAGQQTILVMCPPHLVKKWKREVEETLPVATAVIANSITDLREIQQIKQRPLFVMLKNTAASLGPQVHPTLIPRLVTYQQAKFGQEPKYKLRRTNEGRPAHAWVCPECGEYLKNDDGEYLNEKELAKGRTICKLCAEGGRWETAWHEGRMTGRRRKNERPAKPLSLGEVMRMKRLPSPKPSRFPLSLYIKRYMPDFFDLVIIDEVQDYKGPKTARGLAAGILAEMAPRTLSMTGTLSGGYASTLFYLLWRMSRSIRDEFALDEQTKFVNRYGFKRKTTYAGESEDTSYNRASLYSRSKPKTISNEVPGTTPEMLHHILPNSVFIRLNELEVDLPPYQEEVNIVPMDEEMVDLESPDEDLNISLSQEMAYMALEDKLKEAIKPLLARGNRKLLGAYIHSLLSYTDACMKGIEVNDPDDPEVPIITIPPLSAQHIYPKEQALLDLCQEEREAGRKVLVYCAYTDTKDITDRLEHYLGNAGFRVAVLKSKEDRGTDGKKKGNAPDPSEREAWVQRQLKKGLDVLICNPKLVQTGLDLIDFPTICWYQSDYSVYVCRQASRRSWRIGQTKPVKVVYMCHGGTMQTIAVKLIAAKIKAALAVEGELPEEGISTFASGEDITLELAKLLTEQNLGDGEPDAEELTRELNEASQAGLVATAERNALLADDYEVIEPEPEVDLTPAPEWEEATDIWVNGQPGTDTEPELEQVSINPADIAAFPPEPEPEAEQPVLEEADAAPEPEPEAEPEPETPADNWLDWLKTNQPQPKKRRRRTAQSKKLKQQGLKQVSLW